MTIDSMLVTRLPPRMSTLRSALRAARGRTEIGAVELVGDWDHGDPLVEISAGMGSGELLAQIFRPSISLSTAADDYTVRIALAPPSDEDGHCWLTAIATEAMATDAQIQAVLDVAGTLARMHQGFLVVDGQHVPLEGVSEPQRLAVAAPPPKKPPTNRAFVKAFVTTPVSGDEGWTWFMNLLREVLADHRESPDLRPRYLEVDGEWRAFTPSAPPPEWWPLGQYLLTPEPYLRWYLDPAWGPGDRLTELSMAGDADPGVAESFLPELIALADRDLTYPLLHAWHPDETLGPSGLRQDRNGPWMLLNPLSLTRWLPDLYWAQILGPPWVELFGADTIASTPAHRVEQVAPGRWLIQLTEHLHDVVEDHRTFQTARETAKSHLGTDAFFSRERGTRGVYRAATIPTLVERGIVEPPDLSWLYPPSH